MAVRKKRGAIGTALAWFRKNQARHRQEMDDAVRLLKASSAFLDLARQLNAKYLAFQTAEKTRNFHIKWDIDDTGLLRKGPHRGRRILFVHQPDAGKGSHFQPFEHLDNRLLADFVIISIPKANLRPSPLVQGRIVAHFTVRLAHELSHAFNRVRGTPLPLAIPNFEQGIKAFLRDEVDARKRENTILREILAALPVSTTDVREQEIRDRLKKHLSGNATKLGAVQRDFIEGKERLTYLEAGVLGILMERQVQSERLGFEKIDKLNAYVRKLKLGQPLKNFLKTEFPQTKAKAPRSATAPGPLGPYVDLRLLQRVLQARWKEWARAGRKEKAKEKMLQEHAKAFFPSKLKYAKP